MSIITTQNFSSGSLHIPNTTNLNVSMKGVPDSNNDVQLFIDIYERELLINSLGIIYYNELQSQLPRPTTQKWVDLLNGKDYNINGTDYRWEGLIGDNGQSFIAFYIYCQYLRNNQSIYATGGVVLQNSANSKNVDPTPKYIFSYNNFIKGYQGESFSDKSPRVIFNSSGEMGLDYTVKQDSSFSSLYQYLIDANSLDSGSFSDFKFKFYHKENTFGI